MASLQVGCRQYHVHFLAQITSCEIREVEIPLSLFTLDEVNSIDWDGIAGILQRPNFSGLERVVVVDPVSAEPEGLQAWFMQRLPPGRMRDKFVFQH
jgi:hypothetical protein